ncbi:MAG: GGDEF domain-containing protein [Gallionella sp.]|nr:GGDEF domain-containing protein [Gallionella sp.]
MDLDPRTLLFSLILTDVLMVFCLLVAVHGQLGKRDGMEKWAAAIFLEMLVLVVADLRGIFPASIAIVFAHGLKAASYAMILAALHEFQCRKVQLWHYFAPVAATLVMAFMLVESTRGRYFWGSLIFIFQLSLIVRVLLSDQDARSGRAWRLIFAAIAVMMMVLALRAVAALAGLGEFAQITNGVALHPVQLLAFIAIMATSLLGSIGFILMVKERVDQKNMHLAMTDCLTQIPNRRALMERAGQAMAGRSGSPLALLMIDVDHFKRINDTHGHPVGDEVLRQVVERLLGRLRGCDLLGRYGGEEFCVLAPDTDLNGALNLAESLRESIVFTPFITEKGAIPVSVSIGLAICPLNTRRELKDILIEADSALYTAKQAGRNKVVAFECGIE